MEKELSGKSVSAYITQCADLEKNLYTLRKKKEILTYAKENNNLSANKKQEAGKLPSAVEKEVTKYSYIAIGGTALVILLSFFTDKIKILRSSSALSSIILWIGFCVVFYCVFLKKKWNKMAGKEAAGAPGKGAKKASAAVPTSPADEKLREIDGLILHTEAALADLYHLDILDARYRSLIPLSMIDEYIKTERCTELDGTEGAYAVYEEDLSQGRITDDLTVLRRIADGEDPADTQTEDVQERQDKLLDFIYSADKLAATASSDGAAKLLDYSKQLIEEGEKLAEELA